MFKFFKSGFDKVKNALTKTRSKLSKKLEALFSKPIDPDTLDELEKILYEADLGIEVAEDFTEMMRTFLKNHENPSPEQIHKAFVEHAHQMLSEPPKVEATHPEKGEPKVLLIVGVNGAGKTTSIAKIANSYKKEGKSVLVVAADTFRAAAIEQLSTWSEKCGVDIVKSQHGSDPSAVVFDGLTAAKARKHDIVIVDTAGRLQNKADLMSELEKIVRVGKKVMPEAPHETLLVIDSTTGQNGIDQATVFHKTTPLTGLILTKLDGSAKGGIALSIYKKMGIPIEWIGVGEKEDDLIPFDVESYTKALFDTGK